MFRKFIKIIAIYLLIFKVLISCFPKNSNKRVYSGAKAKISPECMFSLIGKTVEFKSVNAKYPSGDSLTYLIQYLDTACLAKIDSITTKHYNGDSADYFIWLRDSFKENSFSEFGLPDFSYRLISVNSDSTSLKLLPLR